MTRIANTLTAALVVLSIASPALAKAPSIGSGALSTQKIAATLAKQPRGADVLKSGLAAQKKRFALRSSVTTKITARAGSNLSDLRHRGDVARHARLRTKVKATLTKAAKPRVSFKTKPSKVNFPVAKKMTAVGDRFKTKTRGKGGMTSAQARKLNASKKATSPKYAAYRTNQKALRKAKTSRKAAKAARTAKTAARTVKTAKKLRTVGKIATGGAATMVVGAALGVKIPDAVDAALWTAKTLSNPAEAPKRVAALAVGAVKTTGQALKTLTQPKKMAKNLGKAAKSVGCAIASIFKKCR